MNTALTHNPFHHLNGTFTGFVALAANVANAIKSVHILDVETVRMLIQMSSCGSLRLSPPALILG